MLVEGASNSTFQKVFKFYSSKQMKWPASHVYQPKLEQTFHWYNQKILKCQFFLKFYHLKKPESWLPNHHCVWGTACQWVSEECQFDSLDQSHFNALLTLSTTSSKGSSAIILCLGANWLALGVNWWDFEVNWSTLGGKLVGDELVVGQNNCKPHHHSL